MSKELTDKQIRFVDEYLKDLNATQACIRAGYSAKNADKIGSQLLGKTRVKAEIERKQKHLRKKTEVTHDWVIQNLKKVYKRCMQVVPVTDKEGNPTGEFKFEASAANKSLELLGKTLGIFIDKKEHSGKLTLSHEDALKALE